MTTRIYYGSWQAGLMPQGAFDGTVGAFYGTAFTTTRDASGKLLTSNADFGTNPVFHMKGLQTLQPSVTFNKEDIFQICQSNVYATVPGVPEVSITLERVLDGCCPAYLQATADADNPTMQGRAVTKAALAVAIFDESLPATAGLADSIMVIPDAVVDSVSYSLSVDGAFTENLVLSSDTRFFVYPNGGVSELNAGLCCILPAVPNDVADGLQGISFGGVCPNNDGTPCCGLQLKEHLVITAADVPAVLGGAVEVGNTDVNGQTCGPITVLPRNISGVDCTGLVNSVCLQSINISVDFDRTDVNCLGVCRRVDRVPGFPVEVTTEIEVRGSKLDGLNFGVDIGCTVEDPEGCYCLPCIPSATPQTIRIVMCDGTIIYLGTNNTLTDISYSGGDAGGDDVTITYTYTNQNFLTVLHPEDININGNQIGDGGPLQDDYFGNCNP